MMSPNFMLWIDEVISSRKPLNERKLGKLLKKLKKGDILIATELSKNNYIKEAKFYEQNIGIEAVEKKIDKDKLKIAVKSN